MRNPKHLPKDEKFIFNLRVEVNIHKEDKEHLRKLVKPAGLYESQQARAEYEKTLEGIQSGPENKENEREIYFSLDLNPEEFIFEHQEDILRKDLVIASLGFVERHLNHIVKHTREIAISKGSDHGHLDPRRINKIVYSRNSLPIGNVSYTSTTNGDVKPAGSKP